MRPFIVCLVPLLLLLPAAPVSAASASDPAGDETTLFNPAFLDLKACHSPSIDITSLSLEVEDTTAIFQLTILEMDGVPTCGRVPFTGGFYQWYVLADGPSFHMTVAASPTTNGDIQFRYRLQGDLSANGSSAGSLSGNVLTWTVPLAGTLPNGTAYDYRGLTVDLRAEAYQNIAPAPGLPRDASIRVLDRANLNGVTL